MSVRESRPVWGLVVFAVALAVAARARAASEGGCQVTLTVKKTGEEPALGTWVNGSGPTELFLTTGVDYTFTGGCSCSHSVSLSSCTTIGKSAGPSTPTASFTHTFSSPSYLTANDMWVKCVCPAEEPDTESEGSFTVIVMYVDTTGLTSIEPANTYSENRSVRVRARFGSAATCTSFSGTVDISEDGTAIYSQNGGYLPASVELTDGQTTFTAKSIAGAATAFTAPPDPAEVMTTNYHSNSYEIAQWVDNNSNSRVDWCGQWTDTLLSGYQGASGELGIVTSEVTAIGADNWTNNWYGYMNWEGTVIYMDPAAPNHRTNGSDYLEDTVLHESRHVFQCWDGNRNVGGDHGNGPDNDDDPGGGDCAPENTYLASESDIRDVAANGLSGDGTSDTAATVDPLLETDSNDFAAAYR